MFVCLLIGYIGAFTVVFTTPFMVFSVTYPIVRRVLGEIDD